jgi:hypothetical protein
MFWYYFIGTHKWITFNQYIQSILDYLFCYINWRATNYRKNMEHLQCGKPLLVKSECKMILASISIQVLIILASSHVWTRYDNLLLASWCNKINSPKLHTKIKVHSPTMARDPSFELAIWTMTCLLVWKKKTTCLKGIS